MEEEEEEDNNVTNKPNPNQGLCSNSQIFDEVHDGSALKTMGSELNMDSGSDSDSEDDLNIVLNDDLTSSVCAYIWMCACNKNMGRLAFF